MTLHQYGHQIGPGAPAVGGLKYGDTFAQTGDMYLDDPAYLSTGPDGNWTWEITGNSDVGATPQFPLYVDETFAAVGNLSGSGFRNRLTYSAPVLSPEHYVQAVENANINENASTIVGIFARGATTDPYVTEFYSLGMRNGSVLFWKWTNSIETGETLATLTWVVDAVQRLEANGSMMRVYSNYPSTAVGEYEEIDIGAATAGHTRAGLMVNIQGSLGPVSGFWEMFECGDLP